MHPSAIPLACFLSMIRPPGVEFENSYLQLLPVDKGKCPFVRSTSDVGFRLFTRHNPTTYEELFVGDDRRLAASHLDFADRTVICFHAFLENPDAGSSLMLREAFILRGDTNVILVDAQRLEAGPWYLTAADNTWYIGQFAAQFIDYLVSRGLDLKNTHLIGHSLGAQSAGVAGSVLKSGRVARITGLDPALPLFGKLPPAQKLDAADAEFVDVIHTDAGIFGVNNPVGHADFYPNAGISPQPGCELEVLWPRQMLLEKCANRETHKPLVGYYTFQLERHGTPHSSLKKHRHYGYAKRRQTKQDTETTETPNPRHTKKDLSQKSADLEISYQHKEPVYEKLNRKKRFISFFRRAPPEDNDSFLFKMLDFLIKNRKSVIPVVSVMREINTLVKSANGELSHSTKERNNYIGTPPPVPTASTFSLELGKDSPGRALVKRLLGLGGGDKLTIGSGGGGLLGK